MERGAFGQPYSKFRHSFIFDILAPKVDFVNLVEAERDRGGIVPDGHSAV
jgi:hypothetical protein